MNETNEILEKILLDIAELKEKINTIEVNQKQVANAEHKNWHMLSDKLAQYDRILYKLFGKKDK